MKVTSKKALRRNTSVSLTQKNFDFMKYIIATGWWSTEEKLDSRQDLKGSQEIRGIEFHYFWNELIESFSSCSEIVVVDSASPLLPQKKANETWIHLRKNFGHSTNHGTKFCGVSRSFLMSLMYAYANNYDYWVYIEQDALIYGNGIIERAIQSCKSGIIWGDGKGTPQPIQQSFMIFQKDRILDFINNYQRINAPDSRISPEWKFLFSANRFTKHLPTQILIYLATKSNSKIGKKLKKIFRTATFLFNDFDLLPFGYGRQRPINFGDEHFYFQHGSKEELQKFLDTYHKKKKNGGHKRNSIKLF